MSEDEREPKDTLRALIQLRYEQGGWMTWRERTPELTEALRVLSQEQARQLACELLARPDRDKFNWFLGQLNATVPGTLSDLTDELMDRGMLVPEWLYLGAPANTTRHVLRLLETSDNSSPRNGLLLALASIDDDLAHAQFREWRANPPGWCSQLYIPPEDYATRAGWELTPEGDRRQLYRSTCYELVPVDESECEPGAVAVWTQNDASCGWCGRRLVTLLDIDLCDSRCRKVYFGDTGARASRLRIAHCAWCSCYATLYTEIDLEGGSAWSATNESMPGILERVGTGEDEEVPNIGSLRLVLGEQRRTPFEALGRFMLDETGISQIGGHPEWVQDAEYPVCPSCQRRMECIGQVS